MSFGNKRAWLPFAVALAVVASAYDLPVGAQTTAKRPNILWISLEDTSPDFGCYGDKYAVTPRFDDFAKRGVRFTHVFTHAPVCAPSRSGIITGMYPTSIATHHMRCQGVPPPEVKCFTEYLRAAGYYCTNNAKTDYQFAPPFTAWDENGNQAHWRGRRQNQPFFAVFNFINTHESQIRQPSAQTKSLVAKLTADQRHDPAKAMLPPYFPDTPAVRRDWANLYDNVTASQQLVARVLAQLDEDGLADDTIVWIWGDHGRGMPRGKRWVYDSGIQAPLLIRVPEKWRGHAGGDRAAELQPGSVNGDLIAFVDFGPTVLSLAGVSVPKHMQGRPFLGPKRSSPREHVFAARDRMDERYDVIRAVRDKRFKYIRNFMPHLPYAQRIAYMDLMPTMQDWRRLNAEGKLSGPAALFFRAVKPVEELYDTESDPHEVNNLAGDGRYAGKLRELRGRLVEWMLETQDLGLIPEPILDEAQRPGGERQKTNPPLATSIEVADDGAATITLASSTSGASIGYQLAGEQGGAWTVYSHPVTLKPGQKLMAKANRIGFRDSDTIALSSASTAVPLKQAAVGQGADWRPHVIEEGELARLLALKEHDAAALKGVDDYIRALTDSHAAIRFWAVVGLRVAAVDKPPSSAAKSALARLVEKDASEAVKIEAAHTLCAWGEQKKAMSVLAAALNSPQPSKQLLAAQALEDLGEPARPLLPRLKELSAKSSEYVERVTAHTVELLEQRDP